MTKPNLAVKPGAVALMVLMAATRFHHFGSPWALPDASLAVFFFAGLWLGGRGLFALLLAEAAIIDYSATHDLGVSDFCISPAYVFLMLAYAAMWLGGQWCRRFQAWSMTNLIQAGGMLCGVTSCAFLISNTSFYLLSSNVANRSWAQYLDVFATYFPAYLSSTLTYGVVLWSIAGLIGALRSRRHVVSLSTEL